MKQSIDVCSNILCCTYSISELFTSMSPTMRNALQVCIAAVKQDPANYRHCSRQMQLNVHVCEAANMLTPHNYV